MIYTEEISNLIFVEKNKKQEYENWGNGKSLNEWFTHSITSTNGTTLLNKKANRSSGEYTAHKLSS